MCLPQMRRCRPPLSPASSEYPVSPAYAHSNCAALSAEMSIVVSLTATELGSAVYPDRRRPRYRPGSILLEKNVWRRSLCVPSPEPEALMPIPIMPPIGAPSQPLGYPTIDDLVTAVAVSTARSLGSHSHHDLPASVSGINSVPSDMHPECWREGIVASPQLQLCGAETSSLR